MQRRGGEWLQGTGNLRCCCVENLQDKAMDHQMAIVARLASDRNRDMLPEFQALVFLLRKAQVELTDEEWTQVVDSSQKCFEHLKRSVKVVMQRKERAEVTRGCPAKRVTEGVVNESGEVVSDDKPFSPEPMTYDASASDGLFYKRRFQNMLEDRTQAASSTLTVRTSSLPSEAAGFDSGDSRHQSSLSTVSRDPLRLSYSNATAGDGWRASERVRSAVVISVSKYEQFGTQLPNAKSDGAAVALALRRTGWDVSEGDDVSRKALFDLIDQTLLTRANEPESFGAMFLLYFAGHGAESEGLKLACADSSSEMSSWLGLDAIVRHLAESYRGSSASLFLILDCCRSSPSSKPARELTWPQSTWGSITVFYACGPGGCAFEDEGRGRVTRSFLQHLECPPGMVSNAGHSEIIQLLSSVGKDVHRTTRGRQRPCIATLKRWPSWLVSGIEIALLAWVKLAALGWLVLFLDHLLYHGYGALSIVIWAYALWCLFVCCTFVCCLWRSSWQGKRRMLRMLLLCTTTWAVCVMCVRPGERSVAMLRLH